MHDRLVDEATAAWIQVVALLTAAADRAAPSAHLDAAQRSWAFGAQLVACDALALLPADLDARVEAVVLPPEATDASIVDLIAAAARIATRQTPAELPAGADTVLSRLATLRLEAGA